MNDEKKDNISDYLKEIPFRITIVDKKSNYICYDCKFQKDFIDKSGVTNIIYKITNNIKLINKEELKDKIFNKLYDIDCLIRFETEGLETMDRDNYILNKTIKQFKKEILELLKE